MIEKYIHYVYVFEFNHVGFSVINSLFIVVRICLTKNFREYTL